MSENSDPKPRIEATQESEERLEVLELDRTPRPEKLARESTLLAGATEVSYQERAFRPKHKASLDEIRRLVDALDVKRRGLPPIPEAPALPLPPPPVPAPVPDHVRRAIERAVSSPIAAIEPVFSSEAGDVVDVIHEEGGTRRSKQYLVKDGTATPVDDVSSAIDRLPPPRDQGPEPSAPGPAPKEKKRFRLPGRKK